MLYIIPTPIGNTKDITIRGLELLKELNFFICEDTRTTKKLMQIYGIEYKDKKFFSLTSFTNENKINYYKELISNENVGLVSDAGTPGLSDPGKSIIKIAVDNGIKFESLPGSNALIPAVISSGFDTSKFIYLGFLPTKKGRQTQIKFIIESKIPVFIYESVHRVKKLMKQMKEEGFEGQISLNREISKLYEQKITSNIDNIIEKFENGDIQEKGEFVIGFFNKK